MGRVRARDPISTYKFFIPTEMQWLAPYDLLGCNVTPPRLGRFVSLDFARLNRGYSLISCCVFVGSARIMSEKFEIGPLPRSTLSLELIRTQMDLSTIYNMDTNINLAAHSVETSCRSLPSNHLAVLSLIVCFAKPAPRVNPRQ